MAKPRQPNIVLILADDMGYSDLGCYGGEIETPNLDRLARNGLRFTQVCNTARCCPSRASLLTGLYPHQVGMGWMTAADLGHPGYTGDLSDQCRTIPECLRTAGYSTYMSGKWHVTGDPHTTDETPWRSWPTERGFDHYFGSLQSGGDYFKPKALMRDGRIMETGPDFYYTDAISDSARQYIEDHVHATPQKPFFLYTAYTAPHWPLQAKPEDIARYRGRFRAGWDRLRAERYERMKQMNLLADGWGLSPRDEKVSAWDSLTAEQQDVFDLRMAIYAAQLTCMDKGIGRIIETIRRRGLLDDTLILFLSDNGGSAEEVHRKSQDPATFGTAESYESYGRGWANLSNTPYRLFKCWVHEGGIATPLIAHWPNGISCSGQIDCQLAHITDLMPTCLDVSGAKYPDGLPGLAGKSLAPAFSGKAIGRDCIFWEHEGNRALRSGKWKIVARSVQGAWELYDMETDRSELNNLAAADPRRLEEMAREWDEIAKACNVYPLDGRKWMARIAGKP